MKFIKQTVNEYSKAWYIKRHCILAMNRLGTVSESVKLCRQQIIALYVKGQIYFLFSLLFFFFLSFWIKNFTVCNAICLFLCSTEVAVQWIIMVGVLEMAVAMSVQLGSLTHGHPLPQKIQGLHQLLNRHTSMRRKFTSQTQKGCVLSFYVCLWVTVILNASVYTLAINVTSFPTCDLPITLLCDTI